MPNDNSPDDLNNDDERGLDPAGQVSAPIITGLPEGYEYGVTRYADVILESAFADRLADLSDSLAQFHPTLDELRTGGGGRTVFVKRFDDSLADHRSFAGDSLWGKRNITIEKAIGFGHETEPVSRVRGHEIDMFGLKAVDDPFPGVAVEMEWNNKDPFYDRDLINFQALHHEGAIAVGVIVTRGPRLQELIGPVIQSKDGGFKYGQSTTHWNKLIPRVNLGGGGECPLFLVGIEPERIVGIERAQEAKVALDEAGAVIRNWRGVYDSRDDARAAAAKLRARALSLVPPVSGEAQEAESRGDG